MRFSSRGRWLLWLILLFVLGPFLVIVPATLWLGWTMNPVQNFYLGTYAASSTLSSYPGSLTTVRYAEKTAPGRKPEALLPENVVKGSDSEQPLALSPSASLRARTADHDRSHAAHGTRDDRSQEGGQ